MMRKQRDNSARPASSGAAGRNAAAAPVSPSLTVVNDDVDADIFSGNNDCDARGRCVRHPHNRLRKKKVFGGWKVLMTACPDCCMEEINSGRKETRRDAEKSDVGSSGSGIRKGTAPRITTASTAMAPSRSYHPQNGESMPQQRKDSDAATVTTCGTGGSSGHSARFSRPHPEDDVPGQNVAQGNMQRSTSLDQLNSVKRRQEARLEQLTAQYHQLRALNQRLRLDHPGELPADAGPAVSPVPPPPVRSATSPSIVAAESAEREESAFGVERMAYTDARGIAGCYSGAVNRHLVPHGRGVMDYGNGLKVRGHWKNGQLGLSRKGESRLSSCTGRPGISV